MVERLCFSTGPPGVSWGTEEAAAPDEGEEEPPPLEESFTIHLGQLSSILAYSYTKVKLISVVRT